MSTIVERMTKDVALLELAVEQNKDDAWVASSLIDLAACHLGQLRKFEAIDKKFKRLDWFHAWLHAEADKYNVAAAPYNVLPLSPDWLRPVPTSDMVSRQTEQLVQLRKSLQEELDKDDEPHINTVKKYTRAIVRIERQIVESELSLGILVDKEGLEQLADEASAHIKEWSKCLSMDDWFVVSDAINFDG